MEIQRQHLIKLLIDLSSCFLVGLPFFLLYIFGDPFVRGFNCDDESIRYPFKESTVPSAALFIVSIGLTVAVIIVGEYFRAKTFSTPSGWKKIDLYFWLVYHQIILFAFGGLASQSLTDIAKYSIGRLRPHFIEVCDPTIETNLKLKDVCETQKPSYKYILNYTCNPNNPNVKDARLSFMSGHSSFAAYSAVIIAIYLHRRMKSSHLLLSRSFLQVFVIYLAIWVGFTRISDYKHHWSDVLIGLIQGASVAICVAYYVGGCFKATFWGMSVNVGEDGIESSSSGAAHHDRLNIE